MKKSEETDRFQIDTLEERVAPAAASAGLDIAGPLAPDAAGDLPSPDTPCPEGGRP